MPQLVSAFSGKGKMCWCEFQIQLQKVMYSKIFHSWLTQLRELMKLLEKGKLICIRKRITKGILAVRDRIVNISDCMAPIAQQIAELRA